ncbi:MAG: glycosyltransferase family 39 protein [Planctomycetota bacterium]
MTVPPAAADRPGWGVWGPPPWWCLAVLVLGLIPIWSSLGDHPVHGGSEARYGVVARGMAQGDAPWWVPHLHGEPHLTKPPLTYWLIAASIRVVGDGELALRLPSAVAASLTLAVVFAAGVGFGGWRRGALAAAILAVTPLFVVMARLGTTDALLGLFMTAMFATGATWIKNFKLLYLLIFYVFLGLALMTKGPVAGLVPLSLLFWCFAGNRLSVFRRPAVFIGLGLALLPLTIWGLSVVRQAPDAWAVWRYQTLDRATGAGDHPAAWWFFLPVLAVGLLPATALLDLRGWRTPIRGLRRSARRREPASLWWIAVLLTFGVFSAISGKLMSYLLPMAAPLAWLAAESVDRRYWPFPVDKDAHRKLGLSVLVPATLIGAGVMAAILIVQFEPLGGVGAVIPPLMLVLIAGIWGTALWRGRRRWAYALGALTWTSCLVTAVWATTLEDRFLELSDPRQWLEEIRNATGIRDPLVFTVGFTDRRLPYYSHQPTERIDPRILPERWSKLDKHRLVLLAEGEPWDGFASDPHWDIADRYVRLDLLLPDRWNRRSLRVYRVHPDRRDDP